MKRNQIIRKISSPPVLVQAELSAATANTETRTVEMTFYSGATVMRSPFLGDPYELAFRMNRASARLGRLNSGAPLLDSHRSDDGVASILGVVEKAWIADGKAQARVRFSRRPEVDAVWNDVLDGVIRNVSMGTFIKELREVTPDGASMRKFEATSWEPYELSIVSVPADSQAQILSADDAKARVCRIHLNAATPQEDSMKIRVKLLATGELCEIDEREFDERLHAEVDESTTAAAKPAGTAAPTGTTPQATGATRTSADDVTGARLVDEAFARDRAYAQELSRIAAHYKLDDLWKQRHISLATPIEQVLEDAVNERAKRAPRTPNDIGFGEDHESAQWRREQMSLALVSRGNREAPPDSARQYARISMVECALECLGWNGRGRGLHPRGDATEIVQLALHTTSDFPLLLGNVLNKFLLPAYQTAQPTYRMIASQRTFNDFRPHRFLRSGDFPIPLQVNEHGEFKYGTMSENQEQVSLTTYGRIIGLSRQTIVNDDIGAFQDLGSKAGRRIVDFENSTFFSTLMTAGAGLGPALSDGDTVYHANHANITIAGALDNTRLADARAKMMAQTSLDGLKLNVTGRYLLVSPANLTNAETLLASITPNVSTQVNPFAGKLEAVGDANLTGTRFYVLADPGVMPNYIYGYLGGTSGPRTEVRAGFEVDGIEMKVALDFGVGAIDYRGGATGAGA